MSKLMAALPVVLFSACAIDGLDLGGGFTREDALTAVREVNASAAGDVATADVIEISTDFTIGDPIGDALNRMADFWESQQECAVVTVEGDAITIDFGSLDDDCAFAGHRWAGLDTITVLEAEDGELRVQHQLDQFTNGDVTVDGTAVVTWSAEEMTRRVVSDYTWANFVDGSLVEVRGDFETGRLDPELPVGEGGFTLDGTREWTTDSGEWALEMNDLQLRPTDAAPQSGQAVVTNPKGKTLTIVYGRVDDDTTSAWVTGPNGKEFLFHVTVNGDVVDGE